MKKSHKYFQLQRKRTFGDTNHYSGAVMAEGYLIVLNAISFESEFRNNTNSTS